MEYNRLMLIKNMIMFELRDRLAIDPTLGDFAILANIHDELRAETLERLRCLRTNNTIRSQPEEG